MYLDNNTQDFSQVKTLDQANAVITEVLAEQQNKYFLLEHLVIAFGYNCAAFLGYLINKHYYYLRTGQMHDASGGNWFYVTIDSAEEQLHLSRDEQDNCIKKLKAENLVEVKAFGSPPRRHFRLNVLEIAKILVSPNVVTKLRKNLKLNCGNPTNQNAGNPQILIYNKKEEIRDSKESIAPSKDDAKKPAASFPLPDLPDKKPDRPKNERAPGVFVSDEENLKLLNSFGDEATKMGYEDLSEWKKSASPSQVKKHASDYYRLRKWVIPGIVDQMRKGSYRNDHRIAKHRQGSKLVTPGDYDEDNFRRERI